VTDLRGRKDLTPIGLVKSYDWEAIRGYCDTRDVCRGGDYDCPTGGAINVWLQEDWTDPAGELHGTYYPGESNLDGYVNVYFQTGAWLNDNNERPWETSPSQVEYSIESNWSPLMAREHFLELFKDSTGRDYCVDVFRDLHKW